MDLDQRLVFSALFLLQAVLCQSQSKMIVPSQSIVATVGSDVTLPCEVDPVKNLTDLVVEWDRPDLKPRYVHIRHEGLDHLMSQNPQYQGRTQLWECGLQCGDMSLKLSRVRLSDGGTYRCFLRQMNTTGEVTLTVVSVSPVAVSLTKDHSGSPVLRCESRGWYPEPKLLWLDSDGTVLTGGRTEVQRGVSDETFSVSSRLSVEQSPGNTFTCRVRQQQSRQSRETQITVTDEFLESCAVVWILFGLALFVAAATAVGAVVLWKYKIQKIKKEHREAILRITEEIHFTEESEKLMGTKEVLQNLKATMQRCDSDLKADIEEQEKEKASTKGLEKMKIREKIHRNESQIKTFKDIIGVAEEEIVKIDQIVRKTAEKEENLKTELELMTKHLGNKKKSEKAAVQPEPGEGEVKIEVPEKITKTTETKKEHREAILRITEEIHFTEESEKLLGSKEFLQNLKDALQRCDRDLKADIEKKQEKEKASTTSLEKMKIREKIYRNESQIKTFRDIIGLAEEEIVKLDQIVLKMAEKKEKLKTELELMTKQLGNKKKSEKAAVQPEPGEGEVKIEVPEEITETTDHMEGAQTQKLEEQQTTEKEADVLQPLMDAQRTADSEEQPLRDVGLRRSTQKNQDSEQM